MTKYAIFGAGRVGGNMAHYLSSLGHAAVLISHQTAKENVALCKREIADADIVAAAVPDDLIAPWRGQWVKEIETKTVIHFSGAARVDGVYPFHPLYSFPSGQLTAEKMMSIAFACPADGPSFDTVFPNAPNPNFQIADDDRAHYHALAVLSGNFAAYLWNETAVELSRISGQSPETIMGGYLASLVDRFIESPENSLTGPVARHDVNTVRSNLSALKASPRLLELYRNFLKAAWPDYPG